VDHGRTPAHHQHRGDQMRSVWRIWLECRLYIDIEESCSSSEEAFVVSAVDDITGGCSFSSSHRTLWTTSYQCRLLGSTTEIFPVKPKKLLC